MAIRWWDPTGELAQMHRSMDRLFDQFFASGTGSTQAEPEGRPPTYYLPLDILEADDAYVLYASVPGFSPEQVEVTYTDGVLAIQATTSDWQPKGEWLRRERHWGNWSRKLQLPAEVQPDKIAASFDNGILTVTVPKAAKPQPVKIAVGSGDRTLASKN
jgi:HSP20 family protein